MHRNINLLAGIFSVLNGHFHEMIFFLSIKRTEEEEKKEREEDDIKHFQIGSRATIVCERGLRVCMLAGLDE